MDQSLPNIQQGQASQHAAPVGTFRKSNISSKDSGIISKEKFGKLCQDLRLSQSESQSPGSEEEGSTSSMEERSSYGQCPVLHGMNVGGVWHHRSGYEQAEDNYQRWIVSNGNGPLSSSPRSPNTRSYLSFQSRRTHSQQKDEGHPVTTVKASGTSHHQYSRGRNRTSSETQQRAKSSRGPVLRKRGLSETESRPMRDKYGIRHTPQREWERRVFLTYFNCYNLLFIYLNFVSAFLFGIYMLTCV